MVDELGEGAGQEPWGPQTGFDYHFCLSWLLPFIPGTFQLSSRLRVSSWAPSPLSASAAFWIGK